MPKSLRLIPHVDLLRGTTFLHDDTMAEGYCLQIAWLGLVIEFTFAIEER